MAAAVNPLPRVNSLGRLRDRAEPQATLSGRLFRLQARALVEEELGPVAAEVGGLGDTIDDTAALTHDVEVGGEGALGRPRLAFDMSPNHTAPPIRWMFPSSSTSVT